MQRYSKQIKVHPALRTVLICILIGLSFGTYLYFNYDPRPERIWVSILSNVVIGSLMMLSIHFRYYFTVLVNHMGLRIFIMICLLIGVALLGSEMTFLLQSLLWSGAQYKFFNGGSIYILNVLIVLVVGIPVYVSEESKSELNSRISNQQFHVLQLEQQQTVFELELLRAKINPHFLYNVHNTIAGLISKDPGKAEELVVLLSKFFRFTLNKDSITFHTVRDELEVVETYLHMQHIRFEDRMTYSIDADPQVLNLKIASFILQPLVENAVKHGIEACTEHGQIKVKILWEGGNLVINIGDSGPFFSDKPSGGMGLQMVMNKLKLLYADDFRIEFHNNPEKYVCLTIPSGN